MNEPYFTVLALRMVFDLSFFVIVTVLMLNIVVATLVDRFSAFRDERVNHDQCALGVPVTLGNFPSIVG